MLTVLLFLKASRLASAKETIEIKQTHIGLGPIKIKSTSDESLVEVQKSGCEIYCRQPTSNILLVSRKKRLYIEQPFHNFDYGFGRTIKMASDIDVDSRNFTRSGAIKVCARDATVYSSSCVANDHNEATKDSYLPQATGTVVIKSKVASLSDPRLNPALSDLMPILTGDPKLPGLNVDFQFKYGRGGWEHRMVTTSISISKHNSSLRPQIAGFKRARSTSDLLYGDTELLDQFLK
jgi:hypothetical protein